MSLFLLLAAVLALGMMVLSAFTAIFAYVVALVLVGLVVWALLTFAWRTSSPSR